jgi:hypothetical protein
MKKNQLSKYLETFFHMKHAGNPCTGHVRINLIFLEVKNTLSWMSQNNGIRTSWFVYVTSAERYLKSTAKIQRDRMMYCHFVHNYTSHEKFLYEKMSTSEKRTEQRAVMKFCAMFWMTPTDSWKFLNQKEGVHKCSRTLVFDWHKRFRGVRRK